MKRLAFAAVLVLAACKSEDRDAEQKKALATAQHAADEARKDMLAAEAEAKEAKAKLEQALAEEQKAVAENEDAKKALAAMHDEAAKTVADAHKKLDELTALAKDLDAKIAQAKLAKGVGLAVLEQKRREVGESIDKLAKMTKELESSLPK
ncbi:MAG TPA: hypothetical protein VLB44_01530 [Kofleriaceae bacterium]|nr:hypothetical protein [Kofleriaceae bacterium]